MAPLSLEAEASEAMPKRRGSKGLSNAGGFSESLYLALLGFCGRIMQLRESEIPNDQGRPECIICGGHAVHAHGYYERYAPSFDPSSTDKLKIPRWLCAPCGHTLSVLPDEVLPYLRIPVPTLQKHFDAQAGEAPPGPPASVVEEGCLKRAWHRFTLRLTALAACLGQIMQRENLSNAKRFWLGLRRLGNLEEILLHLSALFETSLLRHYRCIQPWASP